MVEVGFSHPFMYAYVIDIADNNRFFFFFFIW